MSSLHAIQLNKLEGILAFATSTFRASYSTLWRCNCNRYIRYKVVGLLSQIQKQDKGITNMKKKHKQNSG